MAKSLAWANYAVLPAVPLRPERVYEDEAEVKLQVTVLRLSRGGVARDWGHPYLPETKLPEHVSLVKPG